jgi:hypothetical protein
VQTQGLPLAGGYRTTGVYQVELQGGVFAVLDTGSSLSAVKNFAPFRPSAAPVAVDEGQGCVAAWKNATTQCAFAVTYGDGSSIVGPLFAVANTSWDGLVLPTPLTLGDIETSVGFEGWDGILGLAFGALNGGSACSQRPCATSLGEALGRFGVCLGGVDGGGTWDIGAKLPVGTRSLAAEPTYVPVHRAYRNCDGDAVYDYFRLRVATFGGQDFGGGDAIVDTGTTYVVVPSTWSGWTQWPLPAALLGTATSPCLHGVVLEGNGTDLPTLRLTFKDSPLVLEWPPSAYLLPMVGGRYCLALAVSAKFSFVVLGSVFLTSYYTVFDLTPGEEGPRVGFAPVNVSGCVDPEPPPALALVPGGDEWAVERDAAGLCLWEMVLVVVATAVGTLVLACLFFILLRWHACCDPAASSKPRFQPVL